VLNLLSEMGGAPAEENNEDEVVNSRTENIGARHLYTIMEKVLEDLSFNVSELSGEEIRIDKEYVRERLSAIVKDYDLSRYIL